MLRAIFLSLLILFSFTGKVIAQEPDPTLAAAPPSTYEDAFPTPAPYWDAFIDVAYRFTLLPSEDLSAIIEGEGERYGQSLEEYTNIWHDKLKECRRCFGNAKRQSITTHSDDAYRRLAVGHFLLYLAKGDQDTLSHSREEIEELASRRALPRIKFWLHMIMSHQYLYEKDSIAFSHHVFRIWEDVIQVLESAKAMTGANMSSGGFINSLPYLYENIVHLVLYNGVVKHKLPNLNSLSMVIWSLQDRLESDRGYYQLAESIWNRMYGQTSDNFNINYAMAFLEGEMHWINFENAVTGAEAAGAYHEAMTYWNLALTWTDTSKGKAAIYVKFMQSMIRILNGKVKGLETVAHPRFDKAPEETRELLGKVKKLFVDLSTPPSPKYVWSFEGFENRKNYLGTMHLLWTNIAQVNVMLARFHKRGINVDIEKIARDPVSFKILSQPYLDYLDFFEYFTKRGRNEIVPDSAYFFASYIASELAELYRLRAPYMSDMTDYDLAFARQLQAVEILPIDINGILTLSIQASQQGEVAKYLENVGPLAERLRNSEMVDTWSGYDKFPYSKEMVNLKTVIPEVLMSAPLIIGMVGGDKTTKELIEDTLYVILLKKGLLQSNNARKADKILSSIGEEIKEGADLASASSKWMPAKAMEQVAAEIEALKNNKLSHMKKTLFRNPDDIYHAFFRSFYNEAGNINLRYTGLVKSAKKK